MIKELTSYGYMAKYEFVHNNTSLGSFDIGDKDEHKEIWCFGIYDVKNRNKGLGQLMLKECLDMLTGNTVELGCLKNNGRALHIYKKFGFVIVKDCGNYYWLRREEN
jgi:ribosomal protein S18 acetylase RimI-like enzyme